MLKETQLVALILLLLCLLPVLLSYPHFQVDEMVVFLHRAEPDLEFEGLLKRRHTQIKYLSGSLMNPSDLERAKVNPGWPTCLLMLYFLFS